MNYSSSESFFVLINERKFFDLGKARNGFMFNDTCLVALVARDLNVGTE